MTPYNIGQDVFQTQADQRFNSFSSPLNPFNTNPGVQGIDPNYLTPSYASPYRPRYQGPVGTQDTNYRPGFFTSANHIFNPFERGGTNYGGNTYMQNRSYYDAIGMRPIDATASLTQSLAVPIAVSLAAFGAFGKFGERVGGSFGRNLVGSAANGFFSPGTASRFASAGGFAGRIAGGFAVPLLAAQGAVSAIDGALFDPYIGQRATADVIRRNTLGISYGDGSGNSITGRGFSRFQAARTAGDISSMAARDITFNQKEVSQLTDYAGRSGLLDFTSGNQLSKRMEEITKQVKVVMAVANTSDFKEAIEIMAQLQRSGVGRGNMASTAGAIGGLASAAGMSAQRLMNTVGMQGQYMYGAAGLTPYVGQLTAAQATASFSSAARSGLMSPALLARMGGVEGAAQSANAALLAGLQSPYSTIVGMNAFQGGAPGSVVGNMSAFGAGMAGNPLAGIGNMNLLRPSLLSNIAENQGMAFTQNRLREIGRTIPNAFDANGKMSAGSAYMILTNTMGMSDDQARAYLEQTRAASDPRTLRTLRAGFKAEETDAFLKFADQNGMNKGIFTTPYQFIADKARKIQEAGSQTVSAFTRAGAAFSDSIESFVMGGMYGVNNTGGSLGVGAFSGDSVRQVDMDLAAKIVSGDAAKFGLGTGSASDPLSMALGSATSGLKSSNVYLRDLRNINSLAVDGDIQAKRLIGARDKTGALDRIHELARVGLIDSRYKNKNEASYLADLVIKSGTSRLTREAGAAGEKVQKALRNTTGISGVLQGAEVISLAQKLDKNPEDVEARNRLSKLLGKDLSTYDLKDTVDSILKNSAVYGTYNVGDTFDMFGGKTSEQINGEIDKLGFEKFSAQYGLKGIKSKEQLLAALADKSGRNILEQGLDPSKSRFISAEDVKPYVRQLKGIQRESSKLTSLARDGLIDFSTYTNGQSALDNKENVLKFGQAVDKFSTAVEAINMGTSKPTDTKSGNTSSGWLPSFFLK